jgi:hypothetical protein
MAAVLVYFWNNKASDTCNKASQNNIPEIEEIPNNKALLAKGQSGLFAARDYSEHIHTNSLPRPKIQSDSDSSTSPYPSSGAWPARPASPLHPASTRPGRQISAN